MNCNQFIRLSSLELLSFLIYFFMKQFQFAFRKRIGNSLIHSFKTSHKVLREQYIKYKGNEMIEINLNEIFDCENLLFEEKHIANVCVLHLQKYKKFWSFIDWIFIHHFIQIEFYLKTCLPFCFTLFFPSLSLYFILWYFDEHSS